MIGVNGKKVYSSIVSYTLFRGVVPDGMCVCHTCDNPICVNPDHLFLGTHSDNMLDSIRKCRFNKEVRASKGEKNGSAKVTENIVRDIRQKYIKGNGGGRRGNSVYLAKKHGITPTQVINIAKRKAWKHII